MRVGSVLFSISHCLNFEDMDDTLYPMSLGLNLACRKNIEEFMLRKLHIEESEIPKMCLELYREYGTTMAGLKVLGYEFDDDEFHAFVHGRLPYETLKPDPVLRNLLLSLPQRKIIFTNADKAHASEVLKRIGLEDCFEGIICFETLNPPLETAKNMDGLDNDAVIPGGEAEPCEFDGTASTGRKKILDNGTSSSSHESCIFFDDSARNIASGKAAGFHTVIVGSSVLVPGADHGLRSISNIKEAIAEIWEDEGEQTEQVIPSTAVETVILA
ncbi:suppressor of disruption of TFIIS [Salix suchowensis]|nr:suppressor of disruption of TFIIS [Salix suchowensis]